MIRRCVLGLAMGLLATGCIFQQPPSEGAFLEGTWTITPADPGEFANFTFEGFFNSDGQLTSVKATRDDNATATLNTGDSTTTVDGDSITITIPRVGGSSTFEGTISEDQNTITGSLTQSVELGDLEVSLPGGDLTLERAGS